jgi:prepilin-type N-terminal cleavage/methylation domain-containing protein
MVRRSARRGFTLLEAVIALAVLAAGVAVVFGLAVHVTNANRTLEFQTQSLDAFNAVAAQIKNAQCDYNPLAPPGPGAVDVATTDPGLTAFNVWIDPGGWTGANNNAPAGSSITFIGRSNGVAPPSAGFPALPATVPQMQIDYMVVPDNNPAVEIPALDVQVRIREITNDAATDALTSGIYVRVYPVRKTCNPRLDESRRGEYL